MPPAKTTMASKFESAAGMNGGYVASSAPMYADASMGVEATVEQQGGEGHRLIQVARRGVTGRQAESRGQGPAPTIRSWDTGNISGLYIRHYQIGVRSIATPHFG